MEELELSGWWWLPDNEDKKVPGVMTFSNEEGIRLKLIGSFKELPQLGSAEEHPLILGSTGEGKLVTLFDAIPLRTSFTSGGFTTQEFWARVGCTGAQFLQAEQARFHKASLEYTHLADWVGRSGFHPDYDTEGGSLTKYRLAYTFPDEVKAAIPDGEVCVTYAFESGGDLLREVSLRQSARIRVDLGHDLTLDEWWSDFVLPFRNLLTLATTRPNALTRISVYSEDKTVSTSKGDREVPVDLFYQQVWHEKVQAKRLFPHDMLFTLHDVAEDFGAVVKHWLRVAKELDSVCNLFFSVSHLPGLYSENQFLNTVQAAESYHRRRIRNRVLPRALHRERVRSIFHQVPAEHEEWLKQVLAYSNEPTLRHRMSDLLDVTQEVVSPLITDQDGFVRKVVDTRNYFTHYDPHLRSKAATRSELHWLRETLSFMVEACLLRELGLAAERRRDLFQRNRRYVYAVSHKGQTDC